MANLVFRFLSDDGTRSLFSYNTNVSDSELKFSLKEIVMANIAKESLKNLCNSHGLGQPKFFIVDRNYVDETLPIEHYKNRFIDIICENIVKQENSSDTTKDDFANALIDKANISKNKRKTNGKCTLV